MLMCCQHININTNTKQRNMRQHRVRKQLCPRASGRLLYVGPGGLQQSGLHLSSSTGVMLAGIILRLFTARTRGTRTCSCTSTSVLCRSCCSSSQPAVLLDTSSVLRLSWRKFHPGIPVSCDAFVRLSYKKVCLQRVGCTPVTNKQDTAGR